MRIAPLDGAVRPYGSQRGFTLVEILVAMAIGLVLTAVVANLFVGSRMTYKTTDDVSRMQENIRYAYHLLTRTAHVAGYRSSPNVRVEDVFTPALPMVTGVEAGGTAADSVTIRFQGSGPAAGAADGSMLDCLGTAVPAGIISTNVFTIANGANGRPALFCSTGGAPVEVVPDVENMQVLYGVDENLDLVADNFAPFSGAMNMANLRAVRIALLFSTPTTQAAAVQDTQQYPLNDVTVGPFNDTRIRRALTLTVTLRNRNP